MIHVVQASQMTKSQQIALVYPREDWGFIEPNIPEQEWIENGGAYHPPVHIQDKRTGEIINIIEAGIKNGIFYKHKTQ